VLLVMSLALVPSPAAAVNGWTSPTPVDTSHGFSSVSCGSAAFCVAVDDFGDAFTYKNGHWGASISIPGAAPMPSVSCASTSFCVAVDVYGNSFITRAGRSWTKVPVEDGALQAVSCVRGSAAYCVAVDASGNAFTYNGGSGWVESPGIDSQSPVSVSCPSAAFCVAVDNQGRVILDHSGGWSAPTAITSSDDSLPSVACSSVSTCVALGVDGDAFLTTDGGHTWNGRPVDSQQNFAYAISCAPGTANFCVAVDLAGNAITLSQGSWNPPTPADPAGHPQSISCPTTSFCAIVDREGYAVASAGPPPPPTFVSPKSYVYWSDGVRSIGRAPRLFRGTGVQRQFIHLRTGSDPSGLAIQGKYLYWAEPAKGTIGRASLDGKYVNESFIHGLRLPTSVAVNADHIYWTDEVRGEIGRANLNGSEVRPAFIRHLSHGPVAIAVDSRFIYWTYGPSNRVLNRGIGRATLAGYVQRTFISRRQTEAGDNVLGGLVSDGAYLYWTSITSNRVDEVGRVANLDVSRGRRSNIDGEPFTRTHVVGFGISPSGPAVCGDRIYWASVSRNAIIRADLNDKTGAVSSQNLHWIKNLQLNNAPSGDVALPGVAVAGCPAPTITTQPSDRTVNAIGSVTFTAAASGNPAPYVQWQVSTTSGDSWQDIPGATASTYQAQANAVTDGDQYRAVFTTASGVPVATSAAMLRALPDQTPNFAGWQAITPFAGALFSAVSASWVVPEVSCPPPMNTTAAQWPGIGNSSSTVQDGTSEGCLHGTPAYGAWYELVGDPYVNNGNQVLLPASQYPVSPGDAMTGSVSIANNAWMLSLTNATKGWTFTFNTPNRQPGVNVQTTAEVALEGPASTGLAKFGSVRFANLTATLNGKAAPLASYGPAALEMTNGAGKLRAVISRPDSGGGFTVSWQGF
jgi:hypothetical protein